MLQVPEIRTHCITMQITRVNPLKMRRNQTKRYRNVKIGDCELAALVDTASELTFMRTDQYVKIGAPKLANRIVKFRGIGSESNCTPGQLSTNVVIYIYIYIYI